MLFKTKPVRKIWRKREGDRLVQERKGESVLWIHAFKVNDTQGREKKGDL